MLPQKYQVKLTWEMKETVLDASFIWERSFKNIIIIFCNTKMEMGFIFRGGLNLSSSLSKILVRPQIDFRASKMGSLMADFAVNPNDIHTMKGFIRGFFPYQSWICQLCVWFRYNELINLKWHSNLMPANRRLRTYNGITSPLSNNSLLTVFISKRASMLANLFCMVI